MKTFCTYDIIEAIKYYKGEDFYALFEDGNKALGIHVSCARKMKLFNNNTYLANYLLQIVEYDILKCTKKTLRGTCDLNDTILNSGDYVSVYDKDCSPEGIKLKEIVDLYCISDVDILVRKPIKEIEERNIYVYCDKEQYNAHLNEKAKENPGSTLGKKYSLKKEKMEIEKGWDKFETCIDTPVKAKQVGSIYGEAFDININHDDDAISLGGSGESRGYSSNPITSIIFSENTFGRETFEKIVNGQVTTINCGGTSYYINKVTIHYSEAEKEYKATLDVSNNADRPGAESGPGLGHIPFC